VSRIKPEYRLALWPLYRLWAFGINCFYVIKTLIFLTFDRVSGKYIAELINAILKFILTLSKELVSPGIMAN